MNHLPPSTPPVQKRLRHHTIRKIAFGDLGVRQMAIARQPKITRRQVGYALTIKYSKFIKVIEWTVISIPRPSRST